MAGGGNPLQRVAVWLDHRFGWHRLPKPLGIVVLAELRKLLRDQNLYDTGQPTGLSVPHAAGDPETSRYLTGSFAVPSGNGDGDGAEPRYLHLAHDRRHLQRPREPATWGARARGSGATSRSSTRSRRRSRGC